MSVSIDILMSTYNGELFIRDQLDSIFNQSSTDWRLIIRDDGSSDNTRQIISEYQEKAPNKIFLIDDDKGKLGSCQSFFRLMSHSNAQYVFFCDQDDVWLQNKIELQMKEMQRIEGDCGAGFPVLVHSDLRVVNESLGLISESLWKYQKLNPNSMHGLNRVLIQNYVTGCTMLVNRALLEYAISGSPKAIMHDWWMLLLATVKGKVVDMPETTVLYRQHNENDTGAKHWSFFNALNLMINERAQLRSSLLKTRVQAEELLNSGLLSVDEYLVVKHYVALHKKKYFSRRIELLRMGFFKYGFMRNVAMFLLI